MWKIPTKRLVAASVSALALFVFPAPQDLDFDEGIAGMSQVYAAGRKGGHESAGVGGGHDLDGHDHTADSHDTDSHDHETDSHDHEDGGHDVSGAKGRGPAYRGGRIGSSKGRGGPSRSVVEKIFERE